MGMLFSELRKLREAVKRLKKEAKDTDAYTKICQLCEGIKDRADNMENDNEVLKMTQEIIFNINKRKDEAEHEFNTLYLQIQHALSKGIPLTGLSRRQILIIYETMNKELKNRQGYTQD